MRPITSRLVLTLAFFLCFAGGRIPASAQSWSNGYSYRRAITIDHTKIPNTDQANFPVLISGSYPYLASMANGGNVINTSGFDILFTSDAGGTTPLAFERESYDSSTGAVRYWVNIPLLSHSADTVLYLFYGNPSVTSDPSSPTTVWDSSYKSVWHLSDHAANGIIVDSTHSNNGSSQVNTNSLTTPGQIASALNFNGSSDYVLSGSYGLSPTNVTLEAWVKPNAAGGVVLSELGQSAINSGWHDAQMEVETNNVIKVCMWANGETCVVAGSGITYGNWYHVVMQYNNATSTLTGYLNGVAGGSVTASKAFPNTLYYGLGATENTNGGNGSFFSGALDEVRVSATVRSADWIAAEFNNQNNPASFYSVAAADSSSGT